MPSSSVFFLYFLFVFANFVRSGKKGNYRLGIINFLINLNTLVIIVYFDLGNFVICSIHFVLV